MVDNRVKSLYNKSVFNASGIKVLIVSLFLEKNELDQCCVLTLKCNIYSEIGKSVRILMCCKRNN